MTDCISLHFFLHLDSEFSVHIAFIIDVALNSIFCHFLRWHLFLLI